MATVEQTLDRILETVRQLPEAQRARLLQKIAAVSKPDQARAATQRLRGKHGLEAPAGRRMSTLLAKGNAGTLTESEKGELALLVEEFEKKTLELAEAIAEAVNGTPSSSPERSDNS